MTGSERSVVFDVAFDLSPDREGKIRVSRNGKPVPGYLERARNGLYRVSLDSARSFRKDKAVERLAYWYTFPEYKKPLLEAEIDSPVQLILRQVEIKVDDVRDALANVTDPGDEPLGKSRVYKAELGLKVHRAIELILKVLLGTGVDGGWRLRRKYRHHKLSVLYDQLETRDSKTTARLEEMFQKAMTVHGDPKFGTFNVPISFKMGSGATVSFQPCEDITHPAAEELRDHLALMDMNSIYGQAYLGDAVQEISGAYLKYPVDVEPFLDFVEAAMREVVLPSVENLLREGS